MKVRNNYTQRNYLSRGGMLVLFLVYLTGLVQPELHRGFLHPHEVESHTAANEEDGCHRNLFHQQKDACKHKAHATPFNKCLVCQSSLHGDQDIVVSSAFVAACTHNTFFHAAVVFPVTIPLINCGSRAPPGLII